MLEAFTRGPLRVAVAVLSILFFTLALPVTASSHKRHVRWKRHKHKHEVVVFVPAHHTRIREYFVVHRRQLPAYYYQDLDDLPPGIRKKLIRQGYLPPGLEKRIHPFPRELDVVLGPPPPCCRRVIIGRDAYLVDRTTNLIVDILANVIGR